VWRKEYVERAVALVETTDRHASVVAYYLAEDSANGICLYEAYLAMKRVSGSRSVFYLDGGNEWNSDYLLND
jgi:beta-galactosidase